MRTFKARAGADAAQLREELNAAGLQAVKLTTQNGTVTIEVPDDVDGVAVDQVAARHFPRSHVLGILAVDFEGATTVAELKARCIQLRNRTALALKERWEG